MPTKKYDRNEILDICFEIFVKYGYIKTTTSMLAEEAGISKALIFHHFKNKKNLYLQILNRCFHKMAMENLNKPDISGKDYFEARLVNSLKKADYIRRNPKINKLLFEAFHQTPPELTQEIAKFRSYLEEKYADENTAENSALLQLFHQLDFRDGVDKAYAFELITIIDEHFREKLAKDVVSGSDINDDNYWQAHLDKKSQFVNMIRFGIQKKEVSDE